MGKLAFRALALVVVIGLLGVGSYAIAGGGSKNFNGSPLTGYEENPDISTVASGSFEARLSNDGNSLHYKLSYSGLEGTVTQAHVHFGKRAVNGGVSFFLCGGSTKPPCPGPNSGKVEGDIVAADVIGPNSPFPGQPAGTAGQGIEPGNLAEILAAMRAGHAYANVHSTKWPGGEIRAQINNRRGFDGGDKDDKDDDD